MPRILLEPISRALVVESPHPSLDGHLRAAGIEAVRLDKVTSEEALIQALQETRAQILFKRSRVQVTREVVEACPDLHLVQLCCIGDDSVDKVACAEHGVLVFNDPVSNARSVVELAIGLLITLSRRLFETNEATHEHQWDKTDKGRFEILGKRLGIVGLGNIGRQVARAADALGVEIAFFDSRPVAQEVGQEMGWERLDSLEALFRTCDMVTVHTSARDAWGHENDRLLDEALPLLGADRTGPSPRIFLNLARANVHTPEALLGAIEKGAVRLAAVDVYPQEPAPGAPTWVNPYAGEPRVVCTPHIGAATQEAQPRIARRVASTVSRFVREGSLRDCVFAPKASLAVPNLRPGNAVLAVVHSTTRGTRKAVSDAIYEAEASTLGSVQLDFDIGIAYDLSVMDRPLPPEGLMSLIERARDLAGDPSAIRAVRQLVVKR